MHSFASANLNKHNEIDRPHRCGGSLWLGGCKTSNVHNGASPVTQTSNSTVGYVFAQTPLIPLANSLASFADSALLGGALPSTPFAISGETPPYRARSGLENRPTSPLRWLTFTVVLRFVAQRRDNPRKQEQIWMTLMISRHGLRLSQTQLLPGETRGYIPITTVPELQTTIFHVLKLAATKDLESLRLHPKDLAGVPKGLATDLLGRLTNFAPWIEGLNRVHMPKLVRIEILEFLAIDETGQSFAIAINLEWDHNTENYVIRRPLIWTHNLSIGSR